MLPVVLVEMMEAESESEDFEVEGGGWGCCCRAFSPERMALSRAEECALSCV